MAIKTCVNGNCDNEVAEPNGEGWFEAFCRGHIRTRELDENGQWTGNYLPAPLDR